MPLYKFYRIVPKDVSQTDCYIGHTVQPLRKRFTSHAKCNNTTTSKALFDRYGKDGLQIVLIHELELAGLEEARREERRLWEEHKDHAVNLVRPWISEEERKEAHRLYYIHLTPEQRARHAETTRAWAIENKEHRAELAHQRYVMNRESYNKHVAEYRRANKEMISARMKAYEQRPDVKLRRAQLRHDRRIYDSTLKYLRILLE